MFLMSPTTSHGSRFFPFFIAVIICVGIFWLVDPATLFKSGPEKIRIEASDYLAKKNYPATLSVLGSGVQRYPRDPELRFLLASAYAESGQANLAWPQYQAAIDINPRHVKSLSALGQAYAVSQQFSTADSFRQRLAGLCQNPPADQAACAARDAVAASIARARAVGQHAQP